jgi:protoheme IX farnesyltransferase
MLAPEAIGWGVFSGVSSTAILFAGTNPLTAFLGAANIFLYAVPYTLSKPRTEMNTWVGALVQSFVVREHNAARLRCFTH